MQGFVVVGLIIEEIWNVNVKCVKITRSRYLQSQYIEKHYARFGGCRPYS